VRAAPLPGRAARGVRGHVGCGACV
jgi:hypothetical protein